ncbi:universal stress protein [Ornithinibacillus bavariensis]|uniref:universal stress protein n=1 Tax=Ornithinibacillus bavariensis TaxID=545502 RepID=UPI003D1EE90A
MNYEYKNIVLAIDGSDASDKAFEKAIHLVKRNNAHLILAHVIDSRTFATAEAYDRSLAERAEDFAKDLVESYVKKAMEYGLENISQCIEYGSPKIKLAKEIASRFNADIIICGATSKNAVERFLIGSVSESITRYAICDVLVVR